MTRRSGEPLDKTESGPPGELTGRVLRGVGVSAAGYAITQTLTLGFYLVLARLATPADFGELAAGSILVAVGILFTESGMLSALVHRRDRLDEAAATAVISTFLAGAFFGLLALAASPLVGAYFDSGTIAAVAAATSGLLLLRTIPVVPTALLQRRFRFVRRTIVEPAGVIAFGTTAVVATANGMGVWGLVLGYYAEAVTDVVLSWSLAGWRPRLRLASIGMWRELVGYGRHVLTATVVIRTATQIPVVLLGRFVGAGSVGQYRYADRIASTPLAVILAAGSYVLFPAFARIATDRERFRAAFIRSLRWAAVIAIPSGLILLPLGEPLATLVFGETWAAAGQAAMALSLVPAAGGLRQMAIEAFQAAGRPELLTRIHGIEAVVGVLAMVVLLPYELVGVAAGISVGLLAGAIYALRKAHAVLGVRPETTLREIVPPFIAGLAMVAILLPIEALLIHAADHGTALGLLLLGAEGVGGVGVYATVLHVLAPGHAGEFAGLIRTARSTGVRPSAAEETTTPEELVAEPIGGPLP